MKKLLSGLVASTLLCGAAMADTAYVGGTFTRLDINDFTRSGNHYVTTVDVVGDNGQQLIFDIDGTVSGYGKQDTQLIHICLQRGPNGVCYEPDIRVIYDDDFRYMVELKLTCNGIAIGSDLEHRNEVVNGSVGNRYRSVELMVSKETRTNGNCNQLRVEVNGLDLDKIDNIDLDLLIAEAF